MEQIAHTSHTKELNSYHADDKPYCKFHSLQNLILLLYISNSNFSPATAWLWSFDFSDCLIIYSHASCFFDCFQQARISFLLINWREWECLAEINRNSSNREKLHNFFYLSATFFMGIQCHSMLERTRGKIQERKRRLFVSLEESQLLKRCQNSSDLFSSSLILI